MDTSLQVSELVNNLLNRSLDSLIIGDIYFDV